VEQSSDINSIRELRRKGTCTKLTNPAHETQKRDNPLLLI